MNESQWRPAGAVAGGIERDFLFIVMILYFSRVLAVASLAGLSSCQVWMFGDVKPDYKPHDKMAVVPQEFLYTGHRPLNDWLDTPVQIQITEMPLTEVFEHPALRDLRVVWMNQPKDNPPITIHRLAITRRQLLWALGQDHQLTMLARTVPGGRSYVEVRARES